MEKYDMTCAFDIKRHKDTYINYLEVLILPDGQVHYAIPSHQEKAIAFAMEKLQVSRDELLAMCPREMYFDFITWLLSLTGAVAVWNTGYLGEPNKRQALKLKVFKLNGIYKGPLPKASNDIVSSDAV